MRIIMNDKTFEQMMAELSTIVEQLEKGDLTLDEAVQKYQEGIALSNALKKKLEEAQLVVTKKLGNEEVPF